MSQEEKVILEFKNLQKEFKGDLLKKNHLAVDGVSCRFLQGKCTGLLGHNGAGKTTSIRMIFGLIRPTGGKILFKDSEISTQDRSHLGYMPEVNKLAKTLNCSEILKFHLGFFQPQWLDKKDRPELIKKTLNDVGLWDVRNKKVKNLSKGMGRRLAWAQATIHQPELIVLDEPFSGLDPVARYEILEWVKEFKEQGKTVLLCTHELWTVRELCEEVHIFNKGKLFYSTLDKAQQSCSTALNSANFQLVVSGITEENLTKLQDAHALKPWSSLSQKEYLARLTFKDYETAISWLNACSAEGVIIVRFADEISVEGDEVYQLFRGGQLQ